MRAGGAGGVPHRPTLNCRLTSASWRRQRRRVGMETPPFIYLSKARMAMIAAHAAKRTRQADLRESVATELVGTE